MKKTLYSALLATAMIPLSAVAQDATTPPPATPPADSSTSDPATPAPDAATPPAAGAMDATEDAADDAADSAGEAMDSAGEAADDAMDATGEAADDATDAAEDAMTPDAAAPGAVDAEPADDAAMDAEEPADDAAMDAEEPADDTADAGTEVEGPFVTVPPTGAWRVSDLEGKNVEDAAGEGIGDISDVLVDENGEVIAVLVGVGGFLGIGAKDVAVAMSSLEFGPGSMEGLSSAPAADAAPAGGMTADPAAPAGGAAPEAAPEAVEPPVVGEDNLPDRIVLNVTREELEAAPAYGEDEADAGGADMGATGTGGMAPAPAQ